MKSPRFPAPFFVVTVITLDPLPSILCKDSPRLKLFPFPTCDAEMMRAPLAFVIVNVAVPVCRFGSLWLKRRLPGLIVMVHCGTVPSVGVGLTEGVGVGCGLPL